MHIAFASGKGGTGKTTLATNMAAVLAANQGGVCYADADVEEPNGHIFLNPSIGESIEVNVPVPIVNQAKCSLCGECADICQFNALAVLGDKALVFESLCHSCGACIELCPERAIDERMRPIGKITRGASGGIKFLSGCLQVGEAQSPPLIRTLKNMLSDSGTTIVDVPPGTSCPVVESVSGCDFVVLVTEPTPFGLSDLDLAYNLMKELHIPCGVVINRSDLGIPDARERIEAMGMNVLLEIPFNREAAVSYSNGVLISTEKPAYAEMMAELYGKIVREVGHE